ncbi:MAG: MBL fold metallo-hydrolase, partial [Lachnospiraceae bacterium]|nr:MBL fold metallo-hydrolase [Lachnospiraceae bacterium]
MDGGWKEYYQCRIIEDRTWLIRDLYGDYCYLLEGEESALLIDAGIGLPGFEEAIRQLTDKQVRVLLTHGHLDHIGGCGYWQEVLIHEKEISTFGMHQNAGYRQIIRGLTEEVGLKLKEEAVKSCINIKIPQKIDFIKEKDVEQEIDLGGRRLIIIETPGHTEGSVCLWEPERETLYSGDTICENRVMLSFPESCSAKCYYMSLNKLAAIQDKIQKIYAGHNRIPISPAWIGHFMDCAAALAGNQNMG